MPWTLTAWAPGHMQLGCSPGHAHIPPLSSPSVAPGEAESWPEEVGQSEPVSGVKRREKRAGVRSHRALGTIVRALTQWLANFSVEITNISGFAELAVSAATTPFCPGRVKTATDSTQASDCSCVSPHLVSGPGAVGGQCLAFSEDTEKPLKKTLRKVLQVGEPPIQGGS